MKTLNEIKKEILELSPYPDQVKLLAVSKKQTPEAISNLFTQGQIAFGENYVQEFLSKREQCPMGIEWHFIGHLQSNKVNSLLGLVHCIHSVDSLKLAQQISAKSKVKNIRTRIFLEVNIGNEDTKAGLSSAEILALWTQFEALDGINILGLMALPPPDQSDEVTTGFFTQLKNLLHTLKNMCTVPDLHSLSELSLGTSSDYQLALKAGSTCIRLGTILFGERPS